FLHTPELNQIALSPELARGRGIDVERFGRNIFLAGGIATAGVVSLAGPIGFVGLLVPHAIRRLSGTDARLMLPASFLLGAAVLVVCDTVARTVAAPSELPVGIVTALLGGPCFIAMLYGKTEEWSAGQ
ncbi:MAG: FecCD family ABC transporter permease, partial [Verrucomicrobiota bacterium]